MKNDGLLMIFLLAVCSFGCRSDRPDAAADSKRLLSVELLCEEASTNQDAPTASVYLKTGDRKTKIAGISGPCSAISPGEYSNYDMPVGTISAVGSWWAGSGDYLYAVTERGKIIVYQGFADELQDTPGFHYQPIVEYDGEKCTFINTREN